MIGDIIYNDLNDEKRLPCIGHAYPIAEHPELAAICEKIPSTTLDLSSPLNTGISLTDRVWGLSFSPDSKMLAVVYEDAPRLRVYDTNNWSIVDGTPSFTDTLTDVDFSPDGVYLAIGFSSGGYRVFKVDGWEEINNLPPSNDTVLSVNFSPCGKYLGVGTPGESDGIYVIVSTRTWETIGENFGGQPCVYSFTGDGRYVASNGMGGTSLIDLVDMKRTGTFIGDSVYPFAQAVDISFDGSRLAYATTSGIAVTNPITREEFFNLDLASNTSDPRMLAFSPDEKYLIFVSSNSSNSKSVYFIDTQNWTAVQDSLGLPGNLSTCVSFSPDSNYLAIGHTDAPYLSIYNYKKQPPTGYFHVPNIPIQKGSNIYYPVLIQAEE